MEPLTPERWAAIDTLFEQALDRPPDERTAFLRARCGDDPALYHAVIALLDSDSEAEHALGESATAFASHLLDEATARQERDLTPGTLVGAYRIEGELGRGGMGTVYQATRADGTFEKQVALKLVKRGMDTDEVLRRFRYERQILAGLDHPHIARLLDAGAAADGRPFLVMERVAGQPITHYAEAHGLDVETRLALFEQVCAAVAYAHRHLVVHRDLKPSNILVSDDGEVKLLDFGIARLLADEDGSADTPVTRPLTQAGQRVLTPEYAAPEQVAGATVTTATDVYALGVILFELLVGRRPVQPGERLSEAVTSDGDRRTLRGDLEVLVAKALHEDAARRYPTAEALGEDLVRLREGRPLAARPDSIGYRARKFVARHRLGVGIGTAVLLTVLVFGAALVRQQRETVRALDRAATTATFLESLFAAADPFADTRQDTLRVRDLLDPALVRVQDEFADQPETRAGLLHVIGETYLRLGLYPEAVEPLREAVSLREHAPPAEHAASLAALAAALRETGATDEAGEAAQTAHRLAEQAGDPALLAHTERQHALVLIESYRTDEAEAILRASLERLEANGADEAEIVATEETLARVLTNAGRVTEAEALYRTALDRYERLYGADDPRRVGVLRHLAFALLMTGRLDEAEATGAEAVAVTRATRPGSGSLATLLAIHGAILRRQGRLDEAEATLREAASLPPRRPADRAVPLGTLASLLHDRGNLAGAIDAQQESMDVLRADRGLDDPSVAYSAVKLAGFLREQGSFERAEQLLLSARDALDGSDHAERHGAPPVASALVELYEAWGRPDEVARWQEQVEASAD